ncbi:ADP-ribose glycohydrolase MACROD1 isoform X2 [Xenopus laevis]|uniref:ADP-ribose glycohydrolase MACROD1 isoform X2 n=1 Tax=Xenopus laevis TaxID=8355 RepID=A0A8J1KKC9_XENLA|nr:ADP-ribose glycohydrolase MACROD1 isoform X2 [Xenopus laevis]XP_041416699.1 ADP-ribose glycohydrolase MACROD1 isoform X2 [Xenopus laevis]
MQRLSVLLRGSGHNLSAFGHGRKVIRTVNSNDNKPTPFSRQFRARVAPAVISASNQRARQYSGLCGNAHLKDRSFSRPRPLTFRTLSQKFTPFATPRGNSPFTGAPSHRFTSLLHCAFFSCSPGPKLYSSMASSGKIDLNSPTTCWKEAKSYLKGLNNKQKRDHYSVKDFIKLKEIPVWKDTAKKANIKQPEEGKYPKNKALDDKISLFRGDITKLEVDAIVNAANSSLLGGGGVDGCIHRAAGPLLKLECSSLGGCQTGLAKMTCGYLLPANYVIHTVGPVVQGDLGSAQEEDLSNCYRNSLLAAVEGKIRSLAFPCISTGVFGYPPEAAADMALKTIREFLEENKEKFDRVIICVFLEKDEEIYLRKLPEYFPLA